ncbi:MAG: response regulator transcription factor [Candidatus Melainabacteria bacterium]|nr:response regulator transcription factor [Candidatus Melainabacteria bacterium]
MNLKEKNLVDLGFVNRLTDLPGELPITNREKEILIQMAQGKTNREISQKLILSTSTVRNHISSIFAKLRISNRSQATAIAIYSGLLNPKTENSENTQDEIKSA